MMDDGEPVEELTVQKVVARYNQRAPRRTREHLDRLGEKVGQGFEKVSWQLCWRVLISMVVWNSRLSEKDQILYETEVQ